MTVCVKVFAHRRAIAVADKIFEEIVEYDQGGMKKALKEWMKCMTPVLSHAMWVDASIEKITVVGIDVTGNMLVGIRRMDRVSRQPTLEL